MLEITCLVPFLNFKQICPLIEYRSSVKVIFVFLISTPKLYSRIRKKRIYNMVVGAFKPNPSN